jgi:hypothetical protein
MEPNMSACPVCGNTFAKVTSSKRVPGGARASWSVECDTCPLPFEISGEAVNLAATNPAQHQRRRTQWAQFLREQAERGEKRAQLY